MSEPQKFDAAQVASLAAEIAMLTAEAAKLRAEAKRADSVANSAEVRLKNKQSELTRAVESQLDHTLIQHPKVYYAR